MSRIPKDGIAQFIANLTVNDYAPTGWPVIWQVDPMPFIGLVNDTLGAYIELSINSYRSKGVDDYRQVWNPALNALQSVFYGLRLFTLSLDCRSFAPHIMATDILESVRLQINNPRSVTSNAFFLATGLAWVRTHPTVSLNYAEKGDVDNRMIWRSTMDIEMSWLSAAQVTDDPGGIIETVGQSEIGQPAGSNDVPGTLVNPDGQVYPLP